MASAAVADVTGGFYFRQREGARLLPVVYVKVVQDAPSDRRSQTFVAKGFFKVAGRTVAKLPEFTATSTPEPVTRGLRVSSATRHAIRAAARKSGSRRVVLTLTYKVTRADPPFASDGPPRNPTGAQDLFLAIPR